jgi:hypothetical protein
MQNYNKKLQTIAGWQDCTLLLMVGEAQPPKAATSKCVQCVIAKTPTAKSAVG